jgi:hypothetical protein
MSTVAHMNLILRILSYVEFMMLMAMHDVISEKAIFVCVTG